MKTDENKLSDGSWCVICKKGQNINSDYKATALFNIGVTLIIQFWGIVAPWFNLMIKMRA